ncbi:MAG: Ig-like domain-containing protein [Parcubacteria group bacterium]|nr:Ig-like domain-containing protein [Parcubacteria group bacterium]
MSSVLDGRTKTTVTFNEPIDEDSLGSVTAYVTRENLPELRLDGTFEKSSNALSYLTNVGLSANTRYVMTVTKGVKDLAGNNLANDFSCTFTWQGSTISSCPTGLPPVVIKILSTGFSPEEVTLKVGMTVLFKNEDSASHWPAAGPHPTHTLCLGFDSNRALSQGETYQYTFTEAKTCPYHDHVSPGLTGKVIVE